MKSPAKTPKASRPKKNEKWPKIRKFTKNGSLGYLLDARIQGKGERLFFTVKSDAETKAEALRVKRFNEGKSGVNIPDWLRIEALTCYEKLRAAGATLTAATEFFLRHDKLKNQGRPCTEATTELLEVKRGSGKRESYVKALKWALGRFNQTFGKQLMNEVFQKAVEDWLSSQSFAMATRRAYIRDIGILFNFGVKRGYCLLNPAAGIERPLMEDDAPAIFTVKQTAALLSAAQSSPDLELLPALAIGFYAGLRTSELRKLEWKDVDFDAGVIEVSGRKAKTRQRRLVDLSPNLREWLLPYQKEDALVAPSWFRGRLEKLKVIAGLSKWPKNGMRHSFVSYHMAKHQNPNMTALQAGHDVDIAFSNYRNLVKPKEAEQFWNILPSNAETIALA